MNGFEKVVIDTNIIFMALYNPKGKAGKVFELANKNKLNLFSTDTVKEEIKVVLKRELNFSDDKIINMIEGLPLSWIKKKYYEKFIMKVKVKHKPDKPVEALSLLLDCGILTADRDFKERIDVNELIKKLDN